MIAADLYSITMIANAPEEAPLVAPTEAVRRSQAARASSTSTTYR